MLIIFINHQATESCGIILLFGSGLDHQALIHIGPVELAAVGISIAVFNQVSKVAIFPLVSVTTSFVAEEDATQRLNTEEDDNETGADHNGVIKKDYAVHNQEIEMEELIPQVGVLFLFFPFLFLFEYMIRIIAVLGVPRYLSFLDCSVAY
jgi:hypothetical protein